MITTNQFKNGLTLEIDGELYAIIDYQHVKPGKGGAFVRTKLRNLRTKNTIDKTFRAEERFQEAFIEERKSQFLYRSGTHFHFMDQETFEELIVDEEKLEDIKKFLKDNMEAVIIMHNHKIIEIKLPIFIRLKVSETEPGIKGDTAKGSFKPAVLESGTTLQVPLFINAGDTVKIDTRTGEYVERV